MTQSLCLGCGEIKLGAFNECQQCDSLPYYNQQVSIFFSEHNFTVDELINLGRVISFLNSYSDSELVRFPALLYFIHKNYPQLLTLNYDDHDPDTIKMSENIYNNHLLQFAEIDPNKKRVANPHFTNLYGEGYHKKQDRVSNKKQKENIGYMFNWVFLICGLLLIYAGIQVINKGSIFFGLVFLLIGASLAIAGFTK